MIDANTIIHTINAAETATNTLREAARTPRKGASEPVTGSRPESPAPISLDLFDQAELIHYCLQGWACITHEEQGDPLPHDDTDKMSRYLREHALWIEQQPWATDLTSELQDHAHTAEGMLGLLPRRIPLPTPCECGQQQWGYPGEGQGGMVIECANGHAVTLAQAAGSEALVSIRGAQKVLGIRKATIVEAVREQWVRNHGTPTRPLINTRELDQELRERLGNRSL